MNETASRKETRAQRAYVELRIPLGALVETGLLDLGGGGGAVEATGSGRAEGGGAGKGPAQLESSDRGHGGRDRARDTARDENKTPLVVGVGNWEKRAGETQMMSRCAFAVERQFRDHGIRRSGENIVTW